MRERVLTMFAGRVTCAVGLVVMLSAACAPATTMHIVPAQPPLDPERQATPDEEEAGIGVMRQCAEVPVLTAAVDVRGSRRGRPVRARFWVGARFDGRIRIEPREHPKPFVLTATADQTVVTSPDGRVLALTESADAIEAVLGAAIDARDLTYVLAGCPRESGHMASYALADGWMRSDRGDRIEMYLRPVGNRRWRVAAMIGRIAAGDRRWRADFHEPVSGVPTRTRLVSVEWNGQRGREFDLDLRLSDLQVQPLLDERVFSQDVPRAAQPMSLSELRSLSPLN